MIDRSQPQAEKLVGRVNNGKYETALAYLEGQPLDVVEAVNTLARLFGNGGWVDGDMGNLVGGYLAWLCERRLSKSQWRMVEDSVRYYSDAMPRTPQTNENYRNLAEQIGVIVDECDDVD